jgi:hypothetical protein
MCFLLESLPESAYYCGMRNIIAGIFGIIFGVFFIGIIEWAGNALFPSEMPFPENKEEWELYMEQLPSMAKFCVILAYAAGGFIAAVVATLIQGRTFYRPAMVATVVLQLFAWLNMMSLPHPFWMWVMGSVPIIPMGWIGFKLLKKGKTTEEFSEG